MKITIKAHKRGKSRVRKHKRKIKKKIFGLGKKKEEDLSSFITPFTDEEDLMMKLEEQEKAHKSMSREERRKANLGIIDDIDFDFLDR